MRAPFTLLYLPIDMAPIGKVIDGRLAAAAQLAQNVVAELPVLPV